MCTLVERCSVLFIVPLVVMSFYHIHYTFLMLSFIALRDGKIDYEDEQGNAILAPWMLPPDEPSVHLHSKGNMNMNINSNNIHHLGNMTGT